MAKTLNRKFWVEIGLVRLQYMTYVQSFMSFTIFFSNAQVVSLSYFISNVWRQFSSMLQSCRAGFSWWEAWAQPGS